MFALTTVDSSSTPPSLRPSIIFILQRMIRFGPWGLGATLVRRGSQRSGRAGGPINSFLAPPLLDLKEAGVSVLHVLPIGLCLTNGASSLGKGILKVWDTPVRGAPPFLNFCHDV